MSFQYMNSGPGGLAGIFLHDKYSENPPAHLAGWWSNCESTRFQMNPDLDMAKGADSFRLCNPPPFLAVLNYASLEVI
jgi:kynureninase